MTTRRGLRSSIGFTIVASGMRQRTETVDGEQPPFTEAELEKLFLALA